jgi:heat shock protein HtpX
MRTWTLLSLLSMAIVFGGQSLGGRQGLLWGLVIALSINCLIYFYGDRSALRFLRSREIEGHDPWSVNKMVRRLSQKVFIPPPRTFIIESSSPQALCTGRNWKTARIYITRGLLDALEPDEIEATLAYNVACIKKLDTLSFTVGCAFAWTLLSITQSMDAVLRWLIGTNKTRQPVQANLFTQMMAPVIRWLLKMAVNQNSYFRTDALAAEIIDDPRSLARALWKLDSYRTTKPFNSPSSSAHMFVVPPLPNRGWSRRIQVHPAASKRIRKIVGYYPI